MQDTLSTFRRVQGITINGFKLISIKYGLGFDTFIFRYRNKIVLTIILYLDLGLDLGLPRLPSKEIRHSKSSNRARA